MTVLDLVKPATNLLKVKSRVDKAIIDSQVFKLHYKMTTALFFICSVLVTAKEYFGTPIDCISNSQVPLSVLNNYCWMMTTFTVPAGHGQAHAYQGVAPYVEGETPTVNQAYYQWVPFVLFLQGLMFYMPYYFWKVFENKHIQNITKDLRDKPLIPGVRTAECELLVKYVAGTIHTHKMYAAKYFFCNILNLANVIGQMFLINKFLGGAFLEYGPEVWKWSQAGPEVRTDPLIEVFPRVTKCTFRKFGFTGTIERHDVMCLLPVNVINEKIYITLWFWIACLSLISVLYVIYMFAVIAIPSVRRILLEQKLKNRTKRELDLLMKRMDLGDWFLVFLVMQNLESNLFYDFICSLSDGITKNKSDPIDF